MMTSWQVHCDHIFAKNLPKADFRSNKYTFDFKYVPFCIELNTFIRFKIANSFLFLIFPCFYFYVMSQSTFPDQFRPRPLIACLNCAAWANFNQTCHKATSGERDLSLFKWRSPNLQRGDKYEKAKYIDEI